MSNTQKTSSIRHYSQTKLGDTLKNLLTTLVSVLLLGLSANAQTSSILNKVQFIDANTVVAVGLDGTIIRSSDGGITWVVQTSGTLGSLLSVSFCDLNNGMVAGWEGSVFSQSGLVLRTTDGGNTWTRQLTVSGRTMNGASLIDANTGTVVGDLGVVFRTTDGGSTWTQQTSGTGDKLYDVQFVSTNIGMAPTGPAIIRTTDGGATWSTNVTGANTSNRDIAMLNANTALVVGSNGAIILRTTSGGASWTQVSSPVTSELKSVCFADANTAYAVGNSGVIIKSTNSGVNWTSQTSGTGQFLTGVSFKDANTGIVVGWYGLILKTTNGGVTWGPAGGASTPPGQPTLASPANGATNQPTTVTLSWNASSGASAYRLQVSTNSSFSTTVYDNANLTSTSQSVGSLATNTTYYWHVSASNNAGTSAYSSTWSFTTSSGGPLFSVTPSTINFGTVTVGTSKKDSVTVSNAGGSTLSITSIASNKSNFAVSPTSASVPPGGSQKVYITFTPTKKTSYTASITFTHNAPGSPSTVSVSGTGASAPRVRRILANAIPDEVALEQNYPNPFNPSTVIEYAVPDESFVKLTIFNIIGQEVATLVNETLPAGYHSASWNASNVNGGALPSGIYIYRLNATSQISGEVSTRSGKMQLMK